MLDFLAGLLQTDNERSAGKLLAMIRETCSNPAGPTLLSDSQCHRVDKKNGIWQFRAGSLRLLWFYDDGKVIVCTTAFLKQSQTTPKEHIRKAAAIRKDYLASKNNRTLVFADE